MKRRPEFLGGYVQRRGWLHAIPTLAMLGIVFALSIVVMILRDPVVNVGLAVVVVACGLSARLPLSRLLAPLSRVWLLLVALVAVQLVFQGWYVGLQVATTLLTCLLAGGLLLLTNTIAELLAAFTVLARPLRLVGVNPERVALAAALMVRSIPYLADLFAMTGRAAAARGLEGDIRARTVPVFLRSVQYAYDTGRALDARGLVD
ncbi:CbiQ family ECF transporter T component [Brevibacterium moorei]|uniref:CbiQ family ECF transporter T component n=1 Tax=Brevibacterium moorei TaxID=2968457 RepID=UPI00211BE189|nr:energy-coupling factor transporter transmembrane protein EcfT [Brevibacterium sp. 68QC2CO]